MSEITHSYEAEALRLAHLTTLRFCRRARAGISYDDLFGAALFGAAKALARYDPARGVKFSSFALSWIRGCVQEELRVWDHLPRSARYQARAEEQATGEYPLWANPPTSLEAVLQTEANEESMRDVFMGDTLTDPEADTAAEALTRIEAEEWQRLLDWLPEKESYVVRRHYFDDQTFLAIAREMGRSESRVQQLARQALGRLATWLLEAGLAEQRAPLPATFTLPEKAPEGCLYHRIRALLAVRPLMVDEIVQRVGSSRRVASKTLWRMQKRGEAGATSAGWALKEEG